MKAGGIDTVTWLIAGIDPGTDGAIAFVDDDGAVESVVGYPTLQLTKGSKKRTLDYHELAEIFRSPGNRLRHAFIEWTWNRPSEGRSGTLIGFYMATLQALATLGIPWTPIAPPSWKKAMKVPAGDATRDKAQSRARASQLMPQSIEHWTPRRSVITRIQAGGRAEAVLIAQYGAHKYPDLVGRRVLNEKRPLGTERLLI